MYKVEVIYEVTKYGKGCATIRVTEADEGFNANVIKDSDGYWVSRATTNLYEEWEKVEKDINAAIERIRAEVERRRKMLNDKPRDRVVVI